MATAAVREAHVAKAMLSNVHVSPRKARLVVDMIRGKQVSEAIGALDFCDKKTAALLKKLVLSAAANAKDVADVDVDLDSPLSEEDE